MSGIPQGRQASHTPSHRCGSILAPQLFLIRKIIFQRLGLNAARTGPVDPQRMLVVLADRTVWGTHFVAAFFV